jgi:hypothetical protein
MKVKYPSGMCTTQCGRRKLDEMSIPELEARVKMNEERLRLARQIGWPRGDLAAALWACSAWPRSSSRPGFQKGISSAEADGIGNARRARRSRSSSRSMKMSWRRFSRSSFSARKFLACLVISPVATT